MIEPGTLHEMMGTYRGFEWQFLWSWWAVGAAVLIMFFNILVTCGRAIFELDAFIEKSGAYAFLSLFIIAIFLVPSRQVLPTEVRSSIAVTDGSPVNNVSSINNGRDMANETLRTSMGLYMMAEWATTVTNFIGRSLHAGAMRPNAQQMPLHWLMAYPLPTGITEKVRDWAARCVEPAMSDLIAEGSNETLQTLEPFAPSPLYTAMGNHRVARGRGMLNLVRQPILCTAYADEVLRDVQRHMATDRTPGQQPLSSVWQQELNVSLESAAKLIVRREVSIATADSPASGLALKYGIAKGLSIISQGLGGMIGLKSGWIGAGLGAASGGLDELSRSMGKLADWIGAAIFFSHYFPVLMGLIQSVIIGFWPLFVLAAIAAPGHMFAPIMGGFVTLIAIFSLPIVYGLIALAVQAAGAVGDSILQSPIAWADKQITILVIQTSGPILFLATVAALGTVAAGMSIYRAVRV